MQLTMQLIVGVGADDGSSDKPQNELIYPFNLDDVVPYTHLLRHFDGGYPTRTFSYFLATQVNLLFRRGWETFMEWDAIGAIGEILGAAAVVLTLGYVSIQVRHAKRVASDANRIARANGIREWILAVAANDNLRQSFDAFTGMADIHSAAAREFGVSEEEASRAHYAIIYFFWLHWGQYSSSMDKADIDELTHVIGAWYGTPPVKHQWNNSPIVRPIIDERFVKFVDGVLGQVR